MKIKKYPVRPWAVLLVSSVVSSGCAGRQRAVSSTISRQELQPVCVDQPIDAKGQAECAQRLGAYLARNVAATVDVMPFFYSDDSGIMQSSGIGVIVSQDGLVLVANHVVAGAEYIIIGLRDAKTDPNLRIVPKKAIPMEIVRSLPEKDVALLRPKHTSAFSAHLRADLTWKPELGELVWHFGKSSFAQRATVRNRSVDVRLDLADMPQSRQEGLAISSATVQKGDSGSPVVTLDGRLVGIVLGKGKGKPEDRTFFRPISTFPELFAGIPGFGVSVPSDVEPADPR